MADAARTFSGTESFRAPREAVYSHFTDPARLAAAMPGVVSSEPGNGNSVRCSVKPSFAFLQTTLKSTVSVDRTAPGSAARVAIESKGIGATIALSASLTFRDGASGGTEVDWTASVDSLKGLVAAVGPSLVRGAAENVIREGFANLHKAIDAT